MSQKLIYEIKVNTTLKKSPKKSFTCAIFIPLLQNVNRVTVTVTVRVTVTVTVTVTVRVTGN